MGYPRQSREAERVRRSKALEFDQVFLEPRSNNPDAPKMVATVPPTSSASEMILVMAG